MKSSKTLTSAVVAAALVGAIGLAYAQTQTPSQSTDPSTPMTNQSSTGTMGSPSNGTMANQPSTGTMGSPSNGTMANQPSTGTMRSPSNGTMMQTERPAQSDRN